MKTIVKVLCVLMCLLMALSVLSACKKKEEPNPSDKTDNPAGPVDPVNPDDPYNPGGQGGSTDPVVDPVDPSDDRDLLDDQMRAKYPGKNVTGIAYAEDLLALAYIVNSSADIRELTQDTVYYLASDIDLNPYWVAETTLDDEVYPPFEPAEPFEGFQEFYGIFDGNGHTISGVYLMSDEIISYDSIGFFWDLYGSVKDLTLENCFVCGKTETGDTYTNVSIGALAGRLLGEGSQIENVSVKSTYVLFEGDTSPDMGGVIGTIEAEDCVLRSVSFEGQVILAGSNAGYPSPAEDVVMAQIVGSAEDNALLLEDCLAGGLLFGVEPENEDQNFCAEGNAYVTLKSCRVETPIFEEDPEGIISIRSKKDLLGLDPNRNYAGITIRLMNDIDLNPGWVANDAKNGTLEVPAVYWNGIPEFAGTFDGQGYTISGLCRIVNLEKGIYSAGGLVDVLCEGAVIQNLTIENSAILAYNTSEKTAGGVLLGGAVARAEKNTTIKNVILGMDIWTFGSVKGSFGGFQPYEPMPNLLKTENSVYIGEIGNLEIASLSKVLEYFDPYSIISGYDDEIFLVSNAVELMEIMELAQDGEDFAGKTIRLTANIDLNPSIKTVATINPETNRLELPDKEQIINKWIAIPTFKGLFDGNGYAISGLYTWKNAKSKNDGNYGGFIDTAKDGAIIKNLIIRDSIFVLNNTGDGSWGSRSLHVGGIVGGIDKTRGVESKYALTLSCVYTDMDVIFLCTNHGTVGGILGFAVRHESEKDEEGKSLSNYTSPYRLEDVVFAGRIINSDYTLKVPYTSPKDQFSMSQIVSDTNWGSEHVISNLLAAGEIISGNESGVGSIFGAKTYSSVKCTNVISGRYTTAPKGAYDPSKSTETAAFNSASWTYDHYLGFYVPKVVSKMIADDELSDTVGSDLSVRGFFVSAVPNPDEIHISTAAELIALAESGKNFEGSTIYLDADIDLNPGWSAKTSIDGDGNLVFPSEPAVTWTAFKEFKGTINGQGHTISGLYSKRTVAGNAGNYGGLIDYQSDGRILNLAIVNSIHIVVSSGDGKKDIHIGGLAADINKVTVKSGDANKDPYALGNSENYGFILGNFFTDMEVWLVSPNHAVVGGLIGMVKAKYNIQRVVFAGKVGNTDKMDGTGAAFYTSAKGNELHLGQIIGCGNFNTGVYIDDSLAVGSIVTGTKGSDARYIHTYVGSDDKGSRSRTSTILFAEAPSESWVRSEGGFYVPQSISDFVKDYRPAMVIDGDHTLTGLTLQHKDKPDSLTVTASSEIPDDVTVIADSAFEGCYFLESVTLPSGLTDIGKKAFFNCTGISSIELPSSLTGIGDNAFANCANLPYTKIYGNAKYLGNESDPYLLLLRATSKAISSCTIHPDTRFINEAAFAGCSELTAIEIPSGITRIGANAFEGCTGLTALEIPASINFLGSYAFKDCTGLTAMEISVGVSSIGEGLFYGCVNLNSLTVASDNAVYEADGNCVIEKSTKTLVAACKASEIPGGGSGVKTIETGAFSGCYGLTTLVIPAGVESIEASAFSDCKALTQVTIPHTVTSIGKNAFSGCEKLTKAIYTSTEANWGGVSKTSADWEKISIEYTLAEENIIHVSTANELLDLAQSGENFKWKIIYLDNDIDLNPGWSAATSIVDGELILPDEPEVIWTAFADFRGTIDGQGHSISGIYSNRSVSKNKGAYGGLFDVAADGVVVKNLMIKNSIHIVQNMGSGSYGTNDIRIGGLAAECDKTSNSGKPTFALTLSNLYFDMDVVFLCSEHATVGGLLGYAVRHNDEYTSPYQMSDTVFAGRIIHTNSEMIVPYTSPKHQFSMSQIVANTNWGSQHVLTNVLAAGQIISGNLGDSGVNPIFGSNTYSGVKTTNVIDGLYTTFPTAGFKASNGTYEADFNGIGWVRFKDGLYVPQGVAEFVKDYVAVFEIVDNALNRITLQPKSTPNCVPISNVGTSITIPEGVTSIAVSAFEGLTNLKSVTLPSTLTTIGEGAFEGCAFLTSIILPQNLTTIGESAFAGTSIRKLVLPASLTTVGDSAFVGMGDLQSVTISEGVVAIGKSAFAELAALKSVTFPKSLTTIGAEAFRGCAGLLSLTYPGTRDEWNAIEMEGAWDTEKLPNVICSDGASCINHTLDDGVVTKEMTCLEHGNRMYTCSVCGSHINEQITSPLDHKRVTDPATATCTEGGLSEGAHCMVCGEITTPQVEIGPLGHDFKDGVCTRCGAKKSSEGLAYTSNGDGTCTVTGMGSCTDSDLVIPDKAPNDDIVTAIGDFAFANTAITSIQIPATIVEIGTGAFANCSALKITSDTVLTENTVFTSSANAIFKDNGATLVRFTANSSTYTLPETVTAIEDYAFSGCSKLINFSVNSGNPNYKAGSGTSSGSIYTKDGKTLVRAKNASSVTIAAGTVNIAAGAFSGCDKLTKITLVASVETIGDYAFYGCSKLATVTNKATKLTYVGTNAFTGTKVTTPPTASAN